MPKSFIAYPKNPALAGKKQPALTEQFSQGGVYITLDLVPRHQAVIPKQKKRMLIAIETLRGVRCTELLGGLFTPGFIWFRIYSISQRK